MPLRPFSNRFSQRTGTTSREKIREAIKNAESILNERVGMLSDYESPITDRHHIYNETIEK